MPTKLSPRITMVTAIAASRRPNTFDTALSPPCPINELNIPDECVISTRTSSIYGVRLFEESKRGAEVYEEREV
jgi:hypothetical protein